MAAKRDCVSHEHVWVSGMGNQWRRVQRCRRHHFGHASKGGPGAPPRGAVVYGPCENCAKPMPPELVGQGWQPEGAN